MIPPINAAKALSVTDLKELVALAKKDEAQEKWEASFTTWLKLIEAEPENVTGYFGASNSLNQWAGEAPEELARMRALYRPIAERAVISLPDSLQIQRQMASLAIRLKDWTFALKLWREIRLKWPDDDRVGERIITCLFAFAKEMETQSLWPAALHFWRELQVEDPSNPAGYYGEIHCLRQMHQNQMTHPDTLSGEIRALTERALTALPDLQRMYDQTGMFAMEQGLWTLAIEVWTKYQTRWPEERWPHIRLAECYIAVRKFRRAYQILRDWLNTDSDRIERHELSLIGTAYKEGLIARDMAFARRGPELCKPPVKAPLLYKLRHRRPKVALVLYANGERFTATAKKLEKSFRTLCKFDHEVHFHDLSRIQKRPWFDILEECKSRPAGLGRRDGYYNAWKAHIVRDTLETLRDGDMLYYVDSSQYYPIGFHENINTLFMLQSRTSENLYTGSFNPWVTHAEYDSGNNPALYEHLGMSDQFAHLLSQPAMLNCSFLLKKGPETCAFVDEWAKNSYYDVISLHHTVDQSIFSALVYKYGMKAFNLCELEIVQMTNGVHAWGKNHNAVHTALNRGGSATKLFIHPEDHEKLEHPFSRWSQAFNR